MRKLRARRGAAPGFAAVRIVSEPAAGRLPVRVRVMGIELVGGAKLGSLARLM
jgi:hypothetical protein